MNDTLIARTGYVNPSLGEKHVSQIHSGLICHLLYSVDGIDHLVEPRVTCAEPDPVALAQSLATRITATRASAGDKGFTNAILQQLREDKLLAVVVPSAHGGPGLGVGATARITQYIGRVSGSAGLLYAMHMSQALSVVKHAPATPFFDDFQRRMVRDQILIASGTSEKGVGGDIFGSICTVEVDPTGALMVTKESPNISYMDHAGAILVSAMREDAKGRKLQVLIAAETDKLALTPGREAGFLGMRGLLNQSYKFTARFEADAVFPALYPAIARDTMTPSIHIFWAALWSGIAWSVLDRTKAYVAKEMGGDAEVGSVVGLKLTQLVDKHHTMNALIRDAIFDYEGGGGQSSGLGMGQTARIKRLKISCSELLNEICQGALNLIGIRAYALGGPYSLAEQLCDALSAPLMVSNYRMSIGNAKIERFIDESL